MCVDNVKLIMSDIHLYESRIEALIKTSIWTVSWIGGILTIQDSSQGVASAYFLFSLSLLMEFAVQIKRKKERVACVSHAIFCLLSSCLLILSFAKLVSVEISNSILFVLSIILMLYICADCALLWLFPITSPIESASGYGSGFESGNDIECFNKNLTEGALGNIKK